MALELPTYKRPSIRSALLGTWDRAMAFLKKAGTMILAISIVLWWLSSYPKVEPPAEVVQARQEIFDRIHNWKMSSPETPEEMWAIIEPLQKRADTLEASHATANSFLGRLGRTVQPVFAPLGYDWQLTVGVIASFAAREVFASTMAIITTGSDAADDEGVIAEIAAAKRDDGITPIFTPAVAWSLLVYFVLAMQCLPTLAVTAREAGGFKYAMIQLVWMCGLAYVGAMIVYQVLS
jgi:ferrous iron transport protein B